MATSRPRAAKAALPSKSTNGAVSKGSSVSEVICPAAPKARPVELRQTHGAVTPLTGPITSVGQLVNGGRTIAKGSVGSFETLAEYTTYLRSLNVHDLRRHAREEAKTVPIDDRERLIKRLETAWTGTAGRRAGGVAPIPQRAPFTQAQIEAQAQIRNQLLKQ